MIRSIRSLSTWRFRLKFSDTMTDGKPRVGKTARGFFLSLLCEMRRTGWTEAAKIWYDPLSDKKEIWIDEPDRKKSTG